MSGALLLGSVVLLLAEAWMWPAVASFAVYLTLLAALCGVAALASIRLTGSVTAAAHIVVFAGVVGWAGAAVAGVTPAVTVGMLLALLPLFATVLIGTRGGLALAALLGVALLVGASVLLGPDAGPVDRLGALLVLGGSSAASWWYEVSRLRARDEALTREGELEAARDQAQEANLLKTRFLANISHEIRTPMNGVLGVARVLLDTPLTDEQRNLGQTILRSGGALLELLNDLLDLAKIEAGHVTVDEEPFDVRVLVEDVGSLFAQSAHAKGVELVVLFDEGLPAIWIGDAQRVRQILSNLVSNAVKFTGRGEVVVQVSGAREGLVLSVRDTGTGVAVADLGRIFEPFIQAESNRRGSVGGTGLGLAVSRQLARAMRGELHVASVLGRGSRFWVVLPLKAGSAARSVAPPHAGTAQVIARHPLVRRMVSDALRELGWRAVEGADGAAVLGSVDVVFADLSVTPDREVIRLLRWTEEAAPHERVVRLPVQRARLAAALRPAAPPKRERAAHDGRGARVLIVEDNPVNQMVARRMLERQGHEVATADDGREALAVVEEGGFDLVLMDVQMPRLDGVEATRELRRRGHTVPVVALTGFALEAERQRCFAAGMDAVLTKPVDAEALQAIALRALDAGGQRLAGQEGPRPGA